MNREQYNSDARYAKVLEQMDLLQIMDVTTTRQHKNGTVVWKLPIKNDNSGKTNIKVGSFSTGYVRNQNSGYSNYQLNKRCESNPQYYPEQKYNADTGEHTKTGKYLKFTTRGCKLMPIEIDRLEYLISYCLKNYYIKNANQVADGKYVPEWYHKNELERQSKNANNQFEVNALQNKLANSVPKWKYDEAMKLGHEQDCGHYDRIQDLESQINMLQEELSATKVRQDVSVIVNGHRYKVL